MNPYGGNSPERQDAATPRWFIEALEKRGVKIGLDVCAQEDTAVCPRYYSPQDNGLAQPWQTDDPKAYVWCNPPFRDVTPWLKKAVHARSEGQRVLMLLKFSPETAWFRAHFPFAQRIELITPRLNYWNPLGRYLMQGVSFASCLWWFGSMVHSSSQTLQLDFWHAPKPKGAKR